MSLENRTATFASFPLLLIGIANISGTAEAVNMNSIIIRLIAFILSICGATYLAAGLWHRSKKGSEGWKYLSISMILFVFWNVNMIFGVLLDSINSGIYSSEISFSEDSLNHLTIFINVLDPILEMVVFIIFFFGLKKMIDSMCNEPWKVFSEEGLDE